MIIKCSYCKGTGRKYANYNYTDICPICGGAGNIDVPSIAICNACKGTGRKYGNYSYLDICSACRGTGVTSIRSY